MALGQFAEEPLATMVRSLADSDTLAIVAGAGVSAEAGLPSWAALLDRLLDRTGRERLDLTADEVRSAWLMGVLADESPLGAAAITEALAGDDLADWIPTALYGGDALRFQPGPIARQVPRLRKAFGTGLQVLTTNYDDLLEQAFADAEIVTVAAPFTGPRGSPAVTTRDCQRITHLHGLLARDGHREGDIVLTESDYHQMARTDWQSSEVGAALMATPCLFIGSSLTDPNLLRYLHAHTGPASPRHYAIFTRQDAYPRGTPREVVEAREAALAARWRASNLEIVFVDHYMEIAQALAEVTRAKQEADGYVGLPERLARWHRRVHRVLLRPPGTGAFSQAQDLLHDALRTALETAVQTVGALGYESGDEVLAATLFLVDADGRSLTNWATTDRVHRDPATIDPIPIDEHSSWVAVRAFCRGAALGEPRDVYASRWHYIRGLPLRTQEDLPIGTLTVASMRREGATMLDDMPDVIEAAFDDTLRQLALDIVELAFETR